jgi:hypothetical protein
MVLQRITWTPEARNAEEWEFDRNNPKWALSYPIETVTGWGWPEFIRRLDATYPSAWRALLWALRSMPIEQGGSGEQRLRLESVEIDNWDEIDLGVPCPVCKGWLMSLSEDEHRCSAAEIAAALPPDEDAEPEPKKGKKKAASGEA